MMEYEEYEASRGITASAGFFILLGLVGAGLVIGTIAGLGIWLGMTHQPVSSFEKDMLNPAFTNAARIMQMVSALFMFFLPAVITARLMNPSPFKYLGYKNGFNVRQFVLVIAIIIICMPLVAALGELNQAIPLTKSLEAYFKKMENTYQTQVEALAVMRSPGEFIFSLLVMALLPALFEETLFRGGMQQILIKWTQKPMLAIAITSIIFSIVHISWYGFLPRVALGMVLGLLFYYSQSIWLSMTAHFINNAFAISYMYYLYTHGKPVRDATEEGAPIWIAIPALLLVVLLLRLFQKISIKRNIGKIPPMDGPSFESNLA
jgi:uncharacterized protein